MTAANRKPSVPAPLLVLNAKVSKADLMEALYGMAQSKGENEAEWIAEILSDVNLAREARGAKKVAASSLRRRVWTEGRGFHY